MNISRFSVPVVVLFLVGCGSGDDAKDIQGKWQAVRFEAKGKTLSGEQAKTMTITIQGNKMTLHEEGGKSDEVGTFTLDPSKSPKTLDYTTIKKSKSQSKFIYELDGDELKLCWRKGGDRPTKFSSENKALFMVLKRID